MASNNRLLIRAESADRLREILRTESLDLNCGGPKRLPSGEWEVEAYAPKGAEQRLRAAGATVEVDARMEKRAESRRAEVGTGDRFQGGRIPPRGTGRKE